MLRREMARKLGQENLATAALTSSFACWLLKTLVDDGCVGWQWNAVQVLSFNEVAPNFIISLRGSVAVPSKETLCQAEREGVIEAHQLPFLNRDNKCAACRF